MKAHGDRIGTSNDGPAALGLSLNEDLEPCLMHESDEPASLAKVNTDPNPSHSIQTRHNESQLMVKQTRVGAHTVQV